MAAVVWRVRWQFGERSGSGLPMSREQARRNAARSNAIDPVTRHWAEPIPAEEALRRRSTALQQGLPERP